MECLRTPLVTGAIWLEEDGERGGGEEFRLYKGMTLSCCDSAVPSIPWLLVWLSEDISVRGETREFLRNIMSATCSLQLTTSKLCQLKCWKSISAFEKYMIIQSIKLFWPLSASFPPLIFSVWSLSSLISTDWCCLFLLRWILFFRAELSSISAGCYFKHITRGPTHKLKSNPFF